MGSIGRTADAPAFRSLFTDDAIYVAGDGRLIKGRDAIGQLLVGSGLSMVQLGEILAVSMLGEVAAILFDWHSRESGRQGMATVVAIASDGDWRIERFHNTDA